MTSKHPNKRPRPSYEDGELRDKSIEEIQERAKVETKAVFLRVLKSAASRRSS